jgi:hypothetical protein
VSKSLMESFVSRYEGADLLRRDPGGPGHEAKAAMVAMIR